MEKVDCFIIPFYSLHSKLLSLRCTQKCKKSLCEARDVVNSALSGTY